jgi:hypothetical protein
LTTKNTDKRDGALHKTKPQEVQRFKRMWEVIGYAIWMLSPSRSKASRTASGLPSSPVGQSDVIVGAVSEDQSLPPLDPTKGVLRVLWSNISEEVEDNGISASVIV